MAERIPDYDLVVIGGGAAGLGAARAGVGTGARTLLVCDGEPGGDCTFYGCVPSKTLLEAARAGASYSQTAARIKQTVAAVAATEDAQTLRGEGLDVALGRGWFVDPDTIVVHERGLRAKWFVIATGSTPAVPDIPGLAEAPYLTNETIFELAELPRSLAVVGGGPVGCELAQGFCRLGSDVTLIDSAERLLPAEEPEAAAVIAEVFTREGIDLRLGTTLDRVERVAPGIELVLRDGSKMSAEQLLVATGRTPGTRGLGLEEIGVDLDDGGHVRVDKTLESSVEGIFAAGDVVGRLQLTHAAYTMGRLAAGNALGRRNRPYREDAIPRVTFTEPEVARVGVRETDAPPGSRIAEQPMSGLDRARTAGQTDGFVKLIAGRRRWLGHTGGGKIIGATIVGGRAGELIHEPTLAMTTGMFTGRLATTTHAYPTWSSAVQLAAAQFFMPVDGREAREV